MASTYDEHREKVRKKAKERMGEQVRLSAGKLGGKYGGREEVPWMEVYDTTPPIMNEVLRRYKTLKSLRESSKKQHAFAEFWNNIPADRGDIIRGGPEQIDSGIDTSQIDGEIDRRRRVYTEEIARQTSLPLIHINSEGWDTGELAGRKPGQRYGPHRFIFGNKPDHPEGAIAFWVEPENQEAYFAEKEEALSKIDYRWGWDRQHDLANKAFSRLRKKYIKYITEKDLPLYGINEE